MIETAQAGLVVDPGNADEASAALNRLLAESNTRAQMGAAARRYAEQAFDVRAVGDLFESVFRAVYDRRAYSRQQT
jgi:glycosyltransferase involved in cell wall biosynthesis